MKGGDVKITWMSLEETRIFPGEREDRMSRPTCLSGATVTE